LAQNEQDGAARRRLIVVGGHTRSIGKTQLVCDLIAAFPQANWIAGKITQYGHGVCAQNGENCDCAPSEHSAAFDWEASADSGTDSARFLAAGAKNSFWLRTKQGFLAEGLPLLRREFANLLPSNGNDVSSLIIESNSLLQFLKPTLYIAVIDSAKDDFKDSARTAIDRADILVFRAAGNLPDTTGPAWQKLPAKILRGRPSVTQPEGQPLPTPLLVLVQRTLDAPPSVII
jgi:hypothetical protein